MLALNGGAIPCLDQVLCTTDAKDCVTSMAITYDCIYSDHHQLKVNNAHIDNYLISKISEDCFNSNRLLVMQSVGINYPLSTL